MIGRPLWSARSTRTGMSRYRIASGIGMVGGVFGTRTRRPRLSAESGPGSSCACNRSSVCCHSDSRVPARTTTTSTRRSSERAVTPNIDAVFPDCTEPMTKPRLTRPWGHASAEGAPAPKIPRSTIYLQSVSSTVREVSVNPSSVRLYRAHHESSAVCLTPGCE